MKIAYPSIEDLTSLAINAGNIMVENFQPNMGAELKEDETPITIADRSINDLVVRDLTPRYPGLRVVGEEGDNGVESDTVVYFDPVDGTIPFSRGVPISAFCISVVDHGKPISGVIYDPFMGRMWYAELGKGAFSFFRHGPTRKIAVSKKSDLRNSMLAMLWWKGAKFSIGAVCEELVNVRGAHWLNPCSIAYFGGLVASGEFDATIFPGGKFWEAAAIEVIVTEAGGKVTDLFGNPLRYDGGDLQGHVMSNGLVHDEIIGVIRAQNTAD